MRSIELDPVVLADLPNIDLVRPAACPRCADPARAGGRLHPYGHGPRWRSVVIPGSDLGRCRFVTCWVQRFRGLPLRQDLLGPRRWSAPRLTYSLASMVAVWLGITERPVGRGYRTRRSTPARAWTDSRSRPTARVGSAGDPEAAGRTTADRPPRGQLCRALKGVPHCLVSRSATIPVPWWSTGGSREIPGGDSFRPECGTGSRLGRESAPSGVPRRPGGLLQRARCCG